MTDKLDLYDEEPDRDMVEAVTRCFHNPALRLASKIMAAPPRQLDPAQEQVLENAAGDLRAVADFVEQALKRTWELRS
jgi:hypothetical protein